MNIEKFELPAGSEFRILREREHLGPGWRLVAIVTASRPLRREQIVYDPRGGYGSRQEVWETGTEVQYVVVRDLDQTVEEALGQVAEAERYAADQRTKCLEQEAELGPLRRKLAGQEENVKQLLLRAERAEVDHEQTEKRNRKLEADIGRIRKEIGAAAMKRILEEG